MAIDSLCYCLVLFILSIWCLLFVSFSLHSSLLHDEQHAAWFIVSCIDSVSNLGDHVSYFLNPFNYQLEYICYHWIDYFGGPNGRLYGTYANR
jgi:hypothetical protein